MPISQIGTNALGTSAVALATQVSGTLPAANGGTNSTATPTAGGAGYGTGTAHAYTAAGTSGQVLTSQGSSAPTWAAPAMTLINTTSFTSASTVTVDGVFSAAYTNYLIIINETAISGNFDLSIQFRTGGVTNTSSNYNAYGLYVTSGGTVTGVNQGGNANANIGNSIDRPNTYTTYVFQPFATANTQVSSTSVGGTRYRAIGSDFSATTSFDGFIITCGSNNHTGTLKVYGLS